MNPGNSSFSQLLNQVHLGSSPEFLEKIPDDTIALSFTSPPYYDDELYTLEDNTEEFGWQSYEDYLEHVHQVLQEILRITIPGGRLVLVLSNSPQTDSEERIVAYWPIIHDVVSQAVASGWIMIDEVIWAKEEDTYEYIEDRKVPETSMRVKHDIITVLRKPGPTRKGNDTLSLPSIWGLQAKGPIKPYNKAYPSFPNELVLRVLSAWSLPGDIILDPYAGSGQVCRLAIQQDRYAIGVEIDEKWSSLWQDINS